MPSRTRPQDWTPADGFVLEPAVDQAVRALSNAIVIAGPGAGKTELLAQRACFLLQTGICPAPKRILALSFKRDAARNLEVRVAKRCAADHAHRFDSLTFESFGKSLLDRFGRALPRHWRPVQDYEIDFDITERNASDLLRSLQDAETGLTPAQMESIEPVKFYRQYFSAKMSAERPQPRTPYEIATVALWYRLLHQRKPSRLNFHMIDRLAELLLRVNPRILTALRSSYSFVFLDEFQDTTDIQYDLIKTAFVGTSAVLTAVGDDKQRIMGWANALKGVFGQFEQDFTARQVRPVMNYRSAPKLVAVQQVIAKELDRNNKPATAYDDGRNGHGECRVFLYDHQLAEAAHLAGMIEKWVKTDHIDPRDICILTRTRNTNYTDALKGELAQRSVKARVESDMQDLLAEPLTIALLDLFKLGCQRKAPTSWSLTMKLLQVIEGDDSEQSSRTIERRLSAFIPTLRSAMANAGSDEEQILELIGQMMSFIGETGFILRHQHYGQGKWYQKQKELVAKNMALCRATLSWKEAIADFEGVDSIPMMTMHKSKGLEYHTIVFVGLEDSALFGWDRDAREERCGFFVALSRAKKRAVFTFSGQRRLRFGWEVQTRRKIENLYKLLQDAGINPELVTT